jgi:hypothetical protein
MTPDRWFGSDDVMDLLAAIPRLHGYEERLRLLACACLRLNLSDRERPNDVGRWLYFAEEKARGELVESVPELPEPNLALYGSIWYDLPRSTPTCSAAFFLRHSLSLWITPGWTGTTGPSHEWQWVSAVLSVPCCGTGFPFWPMR